MCVIKNIIFDFDGVILDSVPVKTEAFRQLFSNFPLDLVNQFVLYHEENGGISRYAKIQYFFENLLNQNVPNQLILEYANKYSLLTKEELANPKYIIDDTFDFIKRNYKQYKMHIASGADENDLKYICENLNLTPYFLSIHGSPQVKNKIVHSILVNNVYLNDETVLIGDSINDYEAAYKNNIAFYGYNNPLLKNTIAINYIAKWDLFD